MHFPVGPDSWQAGSSPTDKQLPQKALAGAHTRCSPVPRPRCADVWQSQGPQSSGLSSALAPGLAPREMGPCASLSVSQEQAGHRNEPHPPPRGPKAPRKCSSQPGDMDPAKAGPGAVPGVLWSSQQPGEWNPRKALGEGSHYSPPRDWHPSLRASETWVGVGGVPATERSYTACPLFPPL